MKYFVHSPFNISYVSGPHFGDIDATGRICIWHLSFHSQVRQTEEGNAAPNKIYIPFAGAIRTPNTSTAFYIRLHHLQLLPEFHKQQHWNIPLRVHRQFSYLGNTSFCRDLTFRNALTNQLLATGITSNVCVDLTTGRSTKLPTEYLEEISKEKLTRTKQPQGFVQPDQPKDCFVHTITVTSSCIDTNDHQNMALYIRDCWNAGSLAACSKSLPHFDKELLYFKVKTVTFLYQGQALIGDELNIACWEHQHDPNTLCFTVTKGSKVTGQCQMEFYYEHDIRLESGDIQSKL
ncbi:uncharacterized protein [Amphiura filiformis]|uniref:uncharacterized protein n=1 Tax=Amphiura filiformis TaxID=82378 RepID=UPI003B221CAE